MNKGKIHHIFNDPMGGQVIKTLIVLTLVLLFCNPAHGKIFLQGENGYVDVHLHDYNQFANAWKYDVYCEEMKIFSVKIESTKNKEPLTDEERADKKKADKKRAERNFDFNYPGLTVSDSCFIKISTLEGYETAPSFPVSPEIPPRPAAPKLISAKINP